MRWVAALAVAWAVLVWAMASASTVAPIHVVFPLVMVVQPHFALWAVHCLVK